MSHVPHCWQLTQKFEMRCAWRPSQPTQHAWIILGLDVQTSDDDITCITIPAGTSTDLGTVPRMLWWFCSPVDIAMAAVVHDKMYELINKSNSRLTFKTRMQRRSEADDVFMLAMQLQPNSWKPRVWAVWMCVRLFGWLFAHGFVSI